MRKFYKINILIDVVLFFYVVVATILFGYSIYKKTEHFWLTNLFFLVPVVAFGMVLHSGFIFAQLFVKSKRNQKTFWYGLLLLIVGGFFIFVFLTSLYWGSWIENFAKYSGK